MSVQITPTHEAVERLTGRYDADDPFAAAIRGTRMAMCVTDCRAPDHPIVFANDAFCALTGYPREELLGRNPRFMQGPDTDPRALEKIRCAIREGRHVAVEVLNYRKSGEPFWNGLFISPVKNSAGETDFFFGSQLDVTKRKLAELALIEAHGSLEDVVEARTHDLQETVEQKTVLLHEVEHRVKNNLQLISSLIQFQTRRTENEAVRAALREVQERVSAVSTVHRRLFQTEDAARFEVAQFLRDLVDDLLGRTSRTDIEIAWDLQPVDAAASKAAPLALLANEVLSHAIRCGFPPGRGGAMRVALSRRNDSFQIEISDGASLGAAHEALSAPSGIVSILKRQLGAEIEWRDNQPGMAAFITVPMDRS